MHLHRRACAPFLLLAITAIVPIAFKRVEAAPFDGDTLRAMDRRVEDAIERGRLPGGVLWFERGAEVHRKVFGNRSVEPEREPMELDTVFDAASLTKVVATTPSIMKLVEQGRLSLDDRIAALIPGFRGDDRKPEVTVRHLLTHTSGLIAGVRRGYEWEGYDHGIALACAEPSFAPAGTAYLYSDINFILLGEIVRRVSGAGLDAFARREVFLPLGMADTRFLPPPGERSRIAPTTRMEDGTVLRGVVHDPTARRMGGVAGHAGLFTTASDLARYARMFLEGGALDGVRVLSEESVALMTSVRTPPLITARRGLGWDIDSPYAGPRGERFPIGSFGHTGWTGTSLWIDPFSRSFLILLSNRNHPTEAGSVLDLRRELGTLAAQAITDFDFALVEGALAPVSRDARRAAAEAASARRGKVRNGIDVLTAADFAPLDGLRVGLVTNHTGIDRRKRTTIDLLHDAENVTLAALFSPEHGIRGTADESVGDGVDQKTGLPVHSLYAGDRRKPSPGHLEGLDALVFDIQDIGCRFYTYVSTMGLCMEAAEEAGIRFVVLDRVNPIGGEIVDGPVLDGARSFTGFHEIPVRHGMTVGELAGMLRAERFPEVELEVIGVEEWRRGMLFDETGVPWVNPSPNMRSLTAALLYPGIGLLEFTNLSVGRGTPLPFELVGAPFVDPDAFARELGAAGLPGVAFVPVRFTPDASKFKDEECGGVRVLVTDRRALRSVDLGLEMARVLHRLHPDAWQTGNLDKLLVHPATARAILADQPLDAIRATWREGREAFAKRRERFLLYP